MSLCLILIGVHRCPAAASVLASFRAQPIVVSETTLSNGLKVVVNENHSAPVVAVQIWYRAGAYYDPGGYTGSSHLLEHMMFKGTKKYGPGRYSEIIERLGGDENAYTSDNYTVYWSELAADRYETEMELEADRMENLLLDTGEFGHEKNVVMEERRLGENEPYDALWEDFYATAFKTHPYRNPIIGWMNDLERISRADLYAHYRKYYNPGNATLLVVGDVNPRRVFAQAGRLFGRIKPGSVRPWQPVEPPQSGEKRLVVKKDVTTPALMIGFHVPGSEATRREDSAFYAFEVMDALLLRGKSSRLYSDLVYRKGQALELWGGNDTEKDPGIFYVFVVPRTFELTDSVEKGVLTQLESLKARPVSDSELTRVKNQVIAEFVYGQERNRGVADQLGRAYTLYGSADYVNQYAGRISAVRKNDIMQAARKYFVDDNRTIGRLMSLGDKKEQK